MTTKLQNVSQQFNFPSEDTIRALIGPYPITSDTLSSSTRERVVNAAIRFFANQTKTREEIFLKVREIIAQNTSDLREDILNNTAQQLTQSLMYIVSRSGESRWNINTRHAVFFQFQH
jgi:hypothetical protein